MEFCEVCGMRPITHKNIKYKEVNYKPVTKNICDQCFNEWKHFNIAQKLLDGDYDLDE